MTNAQLEEQLRRFSERLRQLLSMVEEMDTRLKEVEDLVHNRGEGPKDDINSVPKLRESEYDRMDVLDDAIDSELRRD